RFREVVSGLIEAIQGGQPLSGAMSHYPAAFDSVTRSLVRAGEETGRLQEVLRNLTDNLKWEDELAAHTKRIMIYPAIVATLLVAVIFFMMVHLVPQMTAFVGSMGRSIPPHTRLLIAVSDVFVRYGWAIVLVPALGILALKALAARNPLVRRRVDALKLHLPVAGPILQKVVLSRFISVFALMYSSGIPVTDAIRAAEDSAGNAAVQAGLRRVGLQIADGRNVTAAFQEVDLFPPLVVRMVQVGESTGALDRALLNVNYFYTREVREAIAKAQAMIEPALTVILGALMLWVMLSVLGPIYDTVSQIGI
ncbi:MAG: type II secretion system F family protein, partial [Burkholderiales bacterium]|nr:type II secretion system F family protein [Burkholderiales bacterium]